MEFVLVLVAGVERAVVAQEVLDRCRRRSARGAAVGVDLAAVEVNLVDPVRLDLGLAALAGGLDVSLLDPALQFDRAPGDLDGQLVVLGRFVVGLAFTFTLALFVARGRVARLAARDRRLRGVARGGLGRGLCGRLLL